ncbi:activating signal cointegrator 1 isoform X1 [Osmia lignaria lignaria]|uniref:activating signal cointegrator 1 isoform X1 n=1 Tax=Osmia lignaria lignaria TaxID=1437193 RepID=UPI0014789AD8|nr:activating signal cointegrator 1 [Osmia lignaria]
MENWLNKNLSDILDFPVTNELTKLIIEMQNERDLDEYLKSLLDYSNPKHRQFIAEVKKRHASNKGQTGYKKVSDTDDRKKKQNKKKRGKSKTEEEQESKQAQEIVKVEKAEKQKTKFVNLYTQEGNDRVILLKGRHKCDCEARRHALINNCQNCGRIVCTQEGAGSCFFCGELVCSPKDQSILSSNTKQGDNLYNKLMSKKPNKSLEESIKQRDKLLEYDQSGLQCTKVIDDECDYYQSNNIWLDSKQREKLKKSEEEMHAKRHTSRLNKKVAFDFMAREVVEEDAVDNYNEFDEEQIQAISDSFGDVNSSNICPNIEFDCPMYIELDEPEPRAPKRNIPSRIRDIVQDKEFLEMSDSGLCLSMHQPYASLLVAGIKTHEGRTWYTSHRGRLWIASTSKQSTMEDISNIEQCYRVLKDERIIFPESYPTSSLLGCVTVVDVLPQEEYRKSYPEGENDSPYVFICENPCVLPIKFPIQGKHKIYKLDEKIHHAALKLLEKHTKIALRTRMSIRTQQDTPILALEDAYSFHTILFTILRAINEKILAVFFYFILKYQTFINSKSRF